jgi:hypothetical protein
VVLRTCLLVEELHHIPGRYPDKKTAASNVYMFNMQSFCALIFSAIIILVCNLKYIVESTIFYT